MGKSGLNFIFLVLLLVSSSVVFGAIVGSGNSNINLIVSSGSFVNSNCSAGSAFTGVAAGGNFICNPFVFSITQGIGLLFNPNPITQSGVISLQNATELSIGGINVRNCTGNGHISGFFGNMTPICSINNGNGTVTSISQAEGITLNPNPITSTGVVLLDNATNTTLGGIRLANCTGTARFSGFNASLNPICTAVSGTGGVQQITIYEGLSSNETPITSNATLVLNNASQLLNGGVKIFNCTSGFHVSGWFGNMTPFCSGDLANGTVTSIDNAEGISVNPDPITGAGVVLLNNATTTTIGGSRVLNCSGNGHVSGWDGSMNPFCSANNGNGTVTSIASGSGITLNPDPITSTGTVMATNATLTVLGVTKLTNCSTGFYLNGWNATNIPNCVGELNNGTVTSITEGEGIMANPNPIIAIGNILLRNATELLLGGIKVRNCSSTQGITGWLANMTGICGDLGGAGLGIKQLTFGVGLSGNESPLLTNGTIFLKNASSTELGGVTASNCSILESFTGITGGGAHVCTTNGFGRGIRQLTWIGSVWNVNESPTYTNASVMLNNASSGTVGLVSTSNCSSGQFVGGWGAGASPTCSLPYQNPYCSPLINESCTFYDFNGFPSGQQTGTGTLDAFFDQSSTTSCTSVNKYFGQLGFGFCSPTGFAMLGLTNGVSTIGTLQFKAPIAGTPMTQYCSSPDIPYNCSKNINTTNIIEMSARFSKNDNLTASLDDGDNVTILFGFIMRNNTASTTQAAWLPNNFQNMIAFYHYRNMSNWTAITMLAGNASNQTTGLPLDFNLTGGFSAMNTFKIVRENSTGNMLFYINSSLVANHSTFIPDFTTYSGIMILRHNTTAAQNTKFLLVDYMKYYMSKTTNSLLLESYP